MDETPSDTLKSSAAVLGFWSSVIILFAGAELVLGVLVSYAVLPRVLTIGWSGEFPYAEAYRVTGGTIPSLSFLAALVSCPAYVLQIASIQALRPQAGGRVRRFGLASAAAFAALSGLNCVVQLAIVRVGILNGDNEAVGWLVFQNPGSPMLAAEFAAWFFLGAAFLTVAPSFETGRLETAIRWSLISSAAVGNALILVLATEDLAAGQVFLGVMTALLTSVDVLLIVFFRRMLDSGGRG